MHKKGYFVLSVAFIILFSFSGLAFFYLDPWGLPTNYISNSFNIKGSLINDFTYILQYDKFDSREDVISNLKSMEYDLIIMELYYFDNPWTFSEIDEISSKNTTNSKIILCYMSIGEAENYRPYWQDEWDADDDGIPDENAPEWLGTENPDWDGNYKVKYWMQDWQDIIFGCNTSYFDEILARNFDGVYFDIVDAFEYYEEMGDESAGQKMVDFVGNLSTYAKNINPDFLIVSQNGESLAEYEGYLDSIDGIGREDILYDGNNRMIQEEVNWVEPFLDDFLTAGKFVLEIEYCTIPRFINNCYSYAKENGYICYVGPRDLSIIQINKGYVPD